MNTPMHEGRELPIITLREIDLPEINKWEVGGEYYLVVKVEEIAMNNRKDMEAPKSDKQKLEATFQILSVQELDDGQAEKRRQKEWEHQVAKAMSGE